jgi:hypothetical protein
MSTRSKFIVAAAIVILGFASRAASQEVAYFVGALYG